MATEPNYLGTGWGFPPTFVRGEGPPQASAGTGRVVMVSDRQDIEQSLEILFQTSLGERVMQPKYGADLKTQVFEPMNAAVLTFIEDLLRTAIIYHEPRIKTESLAIVPDQLPGRLNIKIDYLIRGTNSRFNFVYPFFSKESGQEP